MKGGPQGSAAPASELERTGKPFIPGGGGRLPGSTGHHLSSLLPKGRLHAGSSAPPASASTRPFLADVPSESPSHPPHPVTPFVTFGTICNLGGRQHFPGGSAGKESASSARDLGSVPGLGRSPGEGKGYPVQYSGLEDSMGCVVHEVTKSRTRLSHFTFHSHGSAAGRGPLLANRPPFCCTQLNPRTNAGDSGQGQRLEDAAFPVSLPRSQHGGLGLRVPDVQATAFKSRPPVRGG